MWLICKNFILRLSEPFTGDKNIMGWLKRLFGLEKPENAEVNPTPQLVPQASNATFAPETIPPSTATQAIPLERLGLNGEYDQSGLAKREH
jgi:hypothetical protein